MRQSSRRWLVSSRCCRVARWSSSRRRAAAAPTIRSSAVHDVERLRRVRRLDAVLGARADQQGQRAAARARVVLPGAGDPERLVVQPADRRRRDVRRGSEGRGRRARRRDGQRALDVDRTGDRARPHLLGEPGPLRPAADPDDAATACARSTRRTGQIDHHVRQQRLRRHAHRQPAAPRRARTTVPGASSRTWSSSDRIPAKATDRRRATSAPTTSSPEQLVWTFHTIPRPGEYGYETWPRRRLEIRRRRQHLGRHHARPRRTASCFFRPDRRRTISTAPIAPATTCSATACIALDARTGKRLLALPDGASRSLGLRPRRRAEAPDRPPRRRSRWTSSRRRARPDSSTCSSG